MSETNAADWTIEPITLEYDSAIADIIRRGGAEFGAIGDGFGPSDTEVSAMSQHYRIEQHSLYLVARIGDQVVGGGGIAPFITPSIAPSIAPSNDNRDTCELRKLFLLPGSRGLGIGKALTLKCLAFAQSQGYRQCYLDTLASMTSAIALYQALGFEQLEQPLDGTIHGGCDVWMLKQL